MASGVADIGLVSPEWLQNSYDSVELDALLSQVEMPAPFFDEPAPTTTPTLREDAFATASTQELQRLLDKNTNKNTVKSTKTWVNRFETWQRVRGIAVSSYSDPSQLDVILHVEHSLVALQFSKPGHTSVLQLNLLNKSVQVNTSKQGDW
jgi:hypothetical protein